jgi:hypothetical protein
LLEVSNTGVVTATGSDLTITPILAPVSAQTITFNPLAALVLVPGRQT